jgi:hypothetical protein
MRSINLLLFLVLLQGCNVSGSNLTREEEYLRFAAEAKKLVDRRQLMSPMEVKSLEKESGLVDFIHALNEKNKGELNTEDLKVADKFYTDVIVEKYSGNSYQGYLKTRYIFFAVHAFDLAPPHSNDGKQYLIKYTRELIENKRDFNFELTLKCLSSIRGLVEPSEFETMVKITSFGVRFETESLEEVIVKCKNEGSQERLSFAQGLESEVSNLKNLRHRLEVLIR